MVLKNKCYSFENTIISLIV